MFEDWDFDDELSDDHYILHAIGSYSNIIEFID